VRRLPQAAARLLIAASVPGLVAALAAAAGGHPVLHARLVAVYTLPVFVTGVAAAYLASSVPRSRWPLLAAAPALLLLPASAATAAGSAWGRLLLAAVSLLFAAASLFSAAQARGSVRLSLAGLAAAYVSFAAVLASPCFTLLGLHALLSLAQGLAFTAVVAVTVHSFPRTYRAEPRSAAAVAAYLASAAAALLAACRPYYAAGPALLSALLYPLAARLEVAARLLPAAWRRRVEGPAARSHWYFVAGHVAALLLLPIYVAGWLLFILQGDLVAAAHGLSLGFVLPHVEIHVPMMVPVIYRMRHARRYTVINYLLAAAAAVAMVLLRSRGPALLLVAASLAATLYVMWPASRGSRVP